MPSALRQFASIWCIVAAVNTRPGERIEPTAIAAMDLAAAAEIQIGIPKLLGVRRPPYPTGPQTLIVTIDAYLLTGCHLALGWRMPERIIDLMVECRNERQSSRAMVGGFSGVLAAVGQSAATGLVAGSSPDQMHRRVETIARLFDRVRDSLDLGRSLLRGRYLCAVAYIEARGVPVARAEIALLADDWQRVLDRAIAAIDNRFGIYRGRRLDLQAFSKMLDRYGIDWPCEPTGSLDFSDDAFQEMARLHPVLSPIKELRSTLTSFDPHTIAIGRDGRNRVPLRPFASITGRNQPSAKASVLGSPAWVRHLIRPEPGMGLAIIDWQQQEFGIAASLSGDGAMQAAYFSGDPYMGLAIAARAAPAGSTAASYAALRERFKRCALGLQYGVGRVRLARQLGIAESMASELIASHKSAFPKFWTWAEAIEMRAFIDREMRSVFGWRLPVDSASNPRSIRNFPMQANGAEMLRLACCLATEAGISVCAPNHDALLIEAPVRDLEQAVVATQRLMVEASEIVLEGFALRTSVKAVTAPDRWSDPRGRSIWSAIAAAIGLDEVPVHERHAS